MKSSLLTRSAQQFSSMALSGSTARHCRKLWWSGTGSRPSEHSGLASVSLAARYTTRLKLRDWITGRRRPKGAERLCNHAKASSSASTQKFASIVTDSRHARSRRLNQSSTTARTVGGNQCDTQLSEHREANFRNHEIAGETVRGLRPRGQFRQFSQFPQAPPGSTGQHASLGLAPFR